MATSLSSFTPDVVLSIPECADPIAESAIRRAAIEFCNESRAVVVEPDSVAVLAGSYLVEVDVGNGQEIVGFDQVYWDGDPLFPTTENELMAAYGSWKDRTGTPDRYIEGEYGLRLFPIPTAAGTITSKVVSRPTNTATSLDDQLFTKWKDALVDGALAWLLMRKPFFVPEMAAYHRQMFNDWIVTAQSRRIKTTSYAPLRVTCA